jgi:IS30 family transposase
MAVTNRRPPVGVIFHSDRGVQGGFNWSSQRHLITEVGEMGRPAGWMKLLTGRSAMKSPGAPALRREVERLFWRQIAKGLLPEQAAEAVGVSQGAGAWWFRHCGGMPQIALTVSGRYLSFAEREEIALLKAQGCGVREIAAAVGRSPSTVSRELSRNAATRGGKLDYRAWVALWKANLIARRPKDPKLVTNERLRQYVQDRLDGTVTRPDGTPAAAPQARDQKGRKPGRRQDRPWQTAWSPEQIAGRIKVDFPDDESMRISHETIYQALYVQGRVGLKRELSAALRTGRALRVSRARTKLGQSFVTEEVMICERPAEVEDQAVPGHWDGDLILGLGGVAIGTLVERATRFTMLLHLPPHEGHNMTGPQAKGGPPTAGHGAEAVRDAIAAKIATLPEALRKSLTWDQGAQMAQHATLTIKAGGVFPKKWTRV